MISTDYTWDAVEQFQWCFAEVNAGIVCACAPALKPFFARYIPGLLYYHFRSNNRENDGSKDHEPRLPPSNSREQAKEASELQLRDDISEETAMTKHSGVDDETQLWQGTANKETEKILFTTCSVGRAC
jgi:hypothetical protein